MSKNSINCVYFVLKKVKIIESGHYALIKKIIKLSSYIRKFRKKKLESHTVQYMRKGFLIYEEMRKYLVIYEKAVSFYQCGTQDEKIITTIWLY